jgi:hypothetical protein
VFNAWLEASSTLSPFFGYEQLLEPQKPHEHLYELAMDHVRTGYGGLDKLFKDLRMLKEQYNQKASSLEKAIESQLTDFLKTITDLLPFQPASQANFYHFERISNAVKSNAQLRILPTSSVVDSPEKDFGPIMDSLRKVQSSSSLVMDGQNEIARGTEATLTRLKGEIERLRMLYKDDFNWLQVNAKKDVTLIPLILDQVRGILSDIKDIDHLEGVCDYEKSLGTGLDLPKYSS